MLKKLLQKISIRTQLVMLIIGTSVVSMGIGFSIITYNSVQNFKQETLNNSLMLADIIKDFMVGDLMFKQMSDATNETIKKLQKNRKIENVIIYNEKHEVFTRYDRGNPIQVTIPDNYENYYKFTPGYLHIIQKITYKKNELGILYIRISTSDLNQRINKHLFVIVLSSLVLLLLTVFIAFRFESYITSPILHLARVAKNISEKGDYGIKVVKERDDEVGILYDGFNAMLEQIKNHTVDLERVYQEMLSKNAELEDSQNRLQTLTDTTPDAVITHTPDGRIVNVNKTAITLFGYSREEFLRLNVNILNDPENGEEFLARYISQALNWHSPEFEWITLTKNGSKLTTKVRLRKMHFDEKDFLLSIITDISASKRTSSRIKRLENCLTNILESIPSSIITLDENKNIVQWNLAAERLFGIKRADVINKPLGKVMPVLGKYNYEINLTIINNTPTFLYRKKISFTEDPRYCNISFSPVIGEESPGVVIRIDDITEAEKKDQQLQQAQKMETVGTLAGGLAHDFNNVLSGIIGTLSLIQFKMKKNKNITPQEFSKSLATIEQSANRASELVQQLLTLSRKQEILFAPVNLNDSIHNVMKICKNTLDKSINIIYHLSDGKPLVKADATQIEQVLLNLCVNAAHAMTIMKNPGETWGGNLVVKIEKVSAEEPFLKTIQDLHGNLFWKISVKDSGVGMETIILNKIFDPFFTTKGKGEGTGLGLAMAYNIIKQHHGYINVISQKGKGTEFSFYLPELSSKEIIAELPEKEVKSMEGNEIVLIVDDEEIVRQTAKTLLEDLGYQIILAEDGLEGVELYKKHQNKINLVVLDMVMPRMSGKEAFLEMKKINPRVKVLLATGFRKDQRAEEIIKQGVKGFIQKPYTMERLGKLVRAILDGNTITE